MQRSSWMGFGLGLGSSPFSIFFSQLKFFSEETSGLHCPLMPSRLSPLQQTITTGTFTPFLHFVTFACNISCVIHRSNTTTILGWFPQSRFSLPLMSCMVASGHFDLFVFLITFIENEISGKEFDCDIFGLAV